MRVIAAKTLKAFYSTYPDARQGLLSWYEETEMAGWDHPNELKAAYCNASVLNKKRVVLNVCGNKYRLIVDIEYRLKIVFIVWVGTHKQYDKIDAQKISYGKTNKK